MYAVPRILRMRPAEPEHCGATPESITSGRYILLYAPFFPKMAKDVLMLFLVTPY